MVIFFLNFAIKLVSLLTGQRSFLVNQTCILSLISMRVCVCTVRACVHDVPNTKALCFARHCRTAEQCEVLWASDQHKARKAAEAIDATAGS